MSEHVATSSAPSERTIAARRGDRDIWISRGHLRAASAGLVLLLVCSFALGYSVGGQVAVEAPQHDSDFLAEVPGEELVDLLARVETAADRRGEVERLTFPDSLRGVESGEVAAKQALKVLTPSSPSSYSVVVARVPDTVAARDLGKRLEALGLGPVNTSEVEGVFEVKYGSFTSVGAAEATLGKLETLELNSEPVVATADLD